MKNGKCLPLPRDAGFTLLEVMIGLSIMAMVGVMISSALSLQAKAVSKSSQSLVISEQIMSLDRVLGYLSETAPNTAEPIPGKKVLTGSDKSLTAIIAPASGRFSSGISELSLYLTPSDTCDDSEQLVLHWSSTLPGNSDAGAFTDERQLLDCITASEIRYFGNGARTSAPDWQSSWYESYLPIALVLRFETKEISYQRQIRFPTARIKFLPHKE